MTASGLARRQTAPRRHPWRRALVTLALLAPLLAVAQPAQAASSKACENGGYALFSGSSTGTPVIRATDREVTRTIPATTLGATFRVQGRYNQFVVRASDFALFDYAFTGAPNRLDMTGGRFTPVWESKVPEHRGLSLSSPITVELEDEDLVISRTGTGLSMKIQTKDCAQGGVFQMEPERGDGTRTRIQHTLAPEAFYFDNPNFRARVGQFLGSGCTSTAGPAGQFCVRVATRVNIGNDVSRAFVARDSAQVADRVPQPECGAPVDPDIDHCGRVSVWDVASGGRMGFVTGEDAVEVANPPTACVSDCQAQNQVRGRLAVLGHPFPVPAANRLVPAFATPYPPITGP